MREDVSNDVGALDVDDGQIVRLEEERPSEKTLIGKVAARRDCDRYRLVEDLELAGYNTVISVLLRRSPGVLDGAVPFLVDIELAGVVCQGVKNALHLL